MEGKSSIVSVPWTLRQALLVVLAINLLELAFAMPVRAELGNRFLLLSTLDAVLYSGGVLLFVKLRTPGSLNDLGLHTRKLLRSIAAGVSTGILTAGLVLAAGSLVVFLAGRNPQAQTVQQAAQQSTYLWEQALFLGISSVLIPFKEELLFRGFIYPAFRDRVGVVWGILLTAVFFSLAHGSLLRAFPLFIGGITLTYVYQRTGSLYAAIIAHGVWNGVMSILSFWG